MNKLKDLRYIYKPYVPKLFVNNGGLSRDESEKSIFGNLNYSISYSVKSRKNYSLPSYGDDNFYPIVKLRKKE